jgi:diguanylate cyclase (GGDEF)-like protein
VRRVAPVRLFCGAVALAGGALLVAVALTTDGDRLRDAQTVSALLAAGVLLGELLPLKIPRRGEDEELTVSTTFAFALLLVAGLGPALAAQSVASVVQDVVSRKPLWRIAFNVGQYALSLGAASLVLTTTGVGGALGAAPFLAADLPEIAVAAAVFYVVNASLVAVAVALYVDQPVGRYVRDDLGFSAVTGAVLLCLAPIVVVALRTMPELYPLFIVLLLAVYSAGRQAARRHHEAMHDRLTGLINRQRFCEIVDERIAAREPRLAILLLDLDRFKDVNDSLGHLAGDELLVEVAARLGRRVREGDVLARLGGDEFAVLLDGCGRRPAEQVAADLAHDLSVPVVVEGMQLTSSVSIGIALFPDHGDDLPALMRKADIAMYKAKASGIGHHTYGGADDAESASRLQTVCELQGAIDDGDLVLHYQPKVDLVSGDVRGAEALVRWQHPTRGLLHPDAFLHLVERGGLMPAMTSAVLEQALDQVARWQGSGAALTVAVNLSASSLIDEHLPDRIRDLLAARRLRPGALQLEITESIVLSNRHRAHGILTRLREMGVTVSLDDFGTGYSALSYLRDLPVDEVKLDRTFITPMSDDPRATALVASTIALAHGLGLRIVAEGVETQDTLDELARLGCDEAQGYLLSRPVPAEQLERWLRERAGAVPVGA